MDTLTKPAAGVISRLWLAWTNRLGSLAAAFLAEE
jgi:hypothetical protein